MREQKHKQAKEGARPLMKVGCSAGPAHVTGIRCGEANKNILVPISSVPDCLRHSGNVSPEVWVAYCHPKLVSKETAAVVVHVRPSSHRCLFAKLILLLTLRIN